MMSRMAMIRSVGHYTRHFQMIDESERFVTSFYSTHANRRLLKSA
jgi:hypothetical protein